MSQAVKVGIFMTVVLAVLAYFLLKIEDLQLFAPEGQRIEVLFDSVAGLDAKAAVRVAGVRVGRVESIGLEGGRALVVLLLDRPVEPPRGRAPRSPTSACWATSTCCSSRARRARLRSPTACASRAARRSRSTTRWSV